MTAREFRVGITPDMFVDAKGRFESAVESRLKPVPGLAVEEMPAQPGKLVRSEDLDRYDAVLSLGMKVNREALRGVERLVAIARWGVGYDMIDTAGLTDADVALTINPAAVRRPVAEAILTFVFALTTNLLTQDRLVRDGKWRGQLPSLGRNIRGRVLGSIGFGNIAREMFSMAQSLGFARLVACDPHVGEDEARRLGVQLISLEEVLAQSDFVAVNCLLNAQTRGLLGERELRRMKPSAYLINTARGPIVQEIALIRALEERWIAGAGLDVFEQEPLPPGSRLRELDNVVLAPHGLAWTEEIVRDNTLEACENILTIARGEIPCAVVNREVLDRPGFQAKLARWRREA